MEEQSLCERVSKFTLKWLFSIALIIAITIGLAWPYPGAELISYQVGGYIIVPMINVSTIFFVSGLQLNTTIIQDVLKGSGIAFAYGLTAILFITSCMGFIVYHMPLTESEFSIGLAVFSIGPTTLGTGISMVSEAKGHTALAILLTVTSSILGIFTVTYLLHLILLTDKDRGLGDATFDQVYLLLGLVYQVLIPLLTGKVVQKVVPSVRHWAERHNPLMKVIGCVSIALIVWQSVSRSADSIKSIPFYAIFELFGAGLFVHVVFLTFNYCMAAFVFKFKLPDKKAIVIMCSQKTLPVALAVISSLNDMGSQGLMSIPPIIAHLLQILIDSYIQSVWADMPEIEQQELGAASPHHSDDSAPVSSNGES